MLVDLAVGLEYLSMLVGYSGYNQILIAEEDVSKTTFRSPWALGTYKWVVMPFGLKNAGATYHRAMNSMFHDFIDKFMQIYIDDIVVKSSSEDDHLEHLRLSFKRMKNLEHLRLSFVGRWSFGTPLDFMIHHFAPWLVLFYSGDGRLLLITDNRLFMIWVMFPLQTSVVARVLL